MMMTPVAARTTKRTAKTSARHERAKQLAALLQEAKARPGVKEAMEVYGGWVRVNEAVAKFQAYQNPYSPNTVSSSSQAV
jgi:hypothetical protein